MREFCSPSENQESLLTEDSQLRTVEAANNGFRQGNGRNFQNQHYRQPPPQQQPFPRPSPQYRYQQPTPPPYYRQQHQNRPMHYRQSIPPPFYGQQQPNGPHHYSQQQPIPPPHYGQQKPNRPLHYRPQRPFTPPGTKQWDYRKWELAVSQPPPQCERFVVLSYNILANYLALDHRRELYFHIPFYVLDWERRKRNILFELGLWSADIMCLQEVDRFQDLENELKVHGYEGIWKMRTGQAIDGCAIFWRTTRFKLRHEESIEFRNLGLRDNVAQVCVLESRNQNSTDKVSVDSPTSTSDANLVVVCNIHVLFNPKRGEIKLGQVRVLLERAHAVSKLWRDAPVVLCGDFNCTPKSPLYNLILDQKLNLDGIARNQVSGQTTAEISGPNRNYPNSGNGLARAQSHDGTVSTSMLAKEKVDMKHANELPNMDDQNKPCDEVDNSFLAKNSAKPRSPGEMVIVPMESGSDVQHRNENIRTCDVLGIEEEVLDNSKDQFISAHSVSLEQMKESPIGNPEEGVPHVDLEKDVVQELSSLIPSYNDDDVCLEIVSENVKTPCRTQGASYKCSQPSLSSSNPVIETTQQNSVCSDMDKRALETVEGINPSTSSEGTYHVKISAASTSIDLSVDQKSDTMSVSKSGEDREEVNQEHGTTFSSERCNTDATMLDVDACDSELLRHESAETDQSSEKISETAHISDLTPPCSDVPIDFSTSTSSEPATARRYTYDPSSWTPMDIETATGNAECTLLESPLKLKSSYAEVEDYSGTRDSVSKEPQVTSYHRRFAGTVDYIWHSEDLQTVKVLDTIPKQALQNWSLGFPTKKWGSDHLALASQFAFKKDT
ncbi:carbon catabolite repressor protein 4 homolog 6-like isoform X2 [Papaver somniferum]|uniref:carbon catabolite repressor protein 4 homolog 6-like isoform X2 n=1 Tax=Papaver somniferum TaxID=3469 RepID=UPI000E703FD2|nr:carbon catabolite repressor protein 4 homolog 6-like isoform X2 [Papaver somniferum]